MTLKDHVLPHPVNIEKCVAVPDQGTFDVQPLNDAVLEPEVEDLAPVRHVPRVNPELSRVAYEFGQYLYYYYFILPNKTATASKVCKHGYLH